MDRETTTETLPIQQRVQGDWWKYSPIHSYNPSHRETLTLIPPRQVQHFIEGYEERKRLEEDKRYDRLHLPLRQYRNNEHQRLRSSLP